MLRYMDRTHGCLLSAGFDHATADHARNVLDSHIYGFVLQELNFPVSQEEYASAAEAFLHMLPEDQYPHARALTLAVIGGEYDGINRFDFGLELILDGLERRLGALTQED